MFCETCKTLLKRIVTSLNPVEPQSRFEHLNHHATIDTFLAAVKAGCLICRKIRDEAPQLANPERCPPGSQAKLKYDCIYDASSADPDNHDITVTFLATYYGGAPTIELRPIPLSIEYSRVSALPQTTGDDAVLQQAATWLQTCAEEHEFCKTCFACPSQLPTRVLDLRPVNLPPGTFKLVDSSTLTQNPVRYATLSHRWGTGTQEPFQLKQATYQSLCTGMLVASLSGLFQDAVRACLALQLRYLWIDSLCKKILAVEITFLDYEIGIFQDDDLNITVEAHRMAEVYGSAFCNIAALTAVQEGMFADRDPKVISPAATIIDALELGTTTSYAIADKLLWSRSVFNAPLSCRGWVLQEQVLARRTIYFGKEQLLWTCPSGAFCETYPMKDPIWSKDRPFVYQRGFDQMRLTAIAATHTIHNNDNSLTEIGRAGEYKPSYEGAWRMIIEEYVPRQLTNANDKLLAVAGVATPFARVTDDVLLAGLWKKGMPKNLLWMVGAGGDLFYSRQDHKTFKRHTSSNIPSWSWASLNGSISFHNASRHSEKEVARVEDVSMTTKETLGIKVNTAGSLRLRAAALKLVRYERDKPHYGFLPRNVKGSVSIACPVNTYFDIEGSEVKESSYVGAFVTCSVIYDRQLRKITANVYEGLILQPIMSQPREVYRRIGMFHVWNYLDRPEEKQFMPEKSRLADCEVNEQGLIGYPALDFDAYDWMYVFEIL